MRCNTGVAPSLLTDQHLIAEYRELFIPVGQLRKLNWESKSPIPPAFRLGTGHITFWRDKQLYLKRRHESLVEEMLRRGFSPQLTFWDTSEIPPSFLNDWNPSYEDSLLIRERIAERILEKPSWYRVKGRPLDNVEKYLSALKESPVVL